MSKNNQFILWEGDLSCNKIKFFPVFSWSLFKEIKVKIVLEYRFFESDRVQTYNLLKNYIQVLKAKI